jgi:hypothetical protein
MPCIARIYSDLDSFSIIFMICPTMTASDTAPSNPDFALVFLSKHDGLPFGAFSPRPGD